MPKLPKYNSTKLFHKLAREYKEEWIKEKGRKPTRDEWNQIQKWTSKNLYQEFKGRSYRAIKASEIAKKIEFKSSTPETRRCYNIFQLNERDYVAVDWWNIWNTVLGLPENALIQIEAGTMGSTGIVHAGDLDREEVAEIENEIRLETENKSGGLTFQGFIQPVPKKGKNDPKNPCDFYMKFLLSTPQGTIEPPDLVPEVPDFDREDVSEIVLREREAERKRRRERAERIKATKRKKRPKKEVGEKKKPKKKSKKKTSKANVKELRGLIADLRQDVKDGLITKEFYQKEVAKLTEKLEKGGQI